MGYDFAQAVADVVDNAITAKATSISVDIEFDGDDSWVRIADNGHGMKPETLREAMRFGSSRDYEDDDLGKFGLGLKTASLSQCQCLSVASRWNRERADITGYAWDLDHIDRTNKWEIIPLERERSTAVVRDPLKDHPGTVVLWKRLDRLLGYVHPYGETSRKRLAQMCREVEIHLAMVFHRFLSGQVRRRKLKISVNGNAIEPWDPFCRNESKTQTLQPVTFELEHEGATGEVLLEPYILPPQDVFSSKEAADAAGGPNKWNQQQGFYIYRAGRMIQSGGWSHLRANDEHMKLARIAVSFTPALDEAFKVNVAKMRVHLPEALRDGVRTAIGPVLRMARDTYDLKSRTAATPTPAATGRRAGSDSSRSPAATRDLPARTASADGAVVHAGRGRNEMTHTFDEWSSLVLAEAKGSEVEVVKEVIDRLRHT
jgi:hypothetical protein